ncbi:anti-sigma F factor [Calderihabitans maritimus]|uniref:Anti-sigma F factor n=1 Tax=Calderihabitans maritimus TaxID=1246530 RepID=A0A1Z5HPZ9_9FIRM|nr:anti-sigma F factor [Calderihabitans maritimus]GAW91350.1 anti-sigma F factor [Calderihabitans maritimus]
MSTDNLGKLENRVQLKLLSVPENIGLCRVVVASVAARKDLTLNELEEIKVAVSEAVSNAIIHGYDNNPDGIIFLEVKRFEKGLEILVEDKGKGIEDVEKAIEPAYSSNPERIGLGFVFMKSFMDRVEVDSRVGEGTRVRLVKKWPANGEEG